MTRRWWTGWGLAALCWAAPVRAQDAVVPTVLKISPNPVLTTATIEFELKSEICRDDHLPLVSLKIYNVLAQEVAAPALDKPPDLRLDQVRLECGSYKARWDGRMTDGRDARTGVYYVQLSVDGRRVTRKMIVKRRSESS